MQGCRDCDHLLTRSAMLALELRKIATRAHHNQEHAGKSWELCSHQPCKRIAELIEKAGRVGWQPSEVP